MSYVILDISRFEPVNACTRTKDIDDPDCLEDAKLKNGTDSRVRVQKACCERTAIRSSALKC